MVHINIDTSGTGVAALPLLEPPLSSLHVAIPIFFRIKRERKGGIEANPSGLAVQSRTRDQRASSPSYVGKIAVGPRCCSHLAERGWMSGKQRARNLLNLAASLRVNVAADGCRCCPNYLTYID